MQSFASSEELLAETTFVKQTIYTNDSHWNLGSIKLSKSQERHVLVNWGFVSTSGKDGFWIYSKG